MIQYRHDGGTVVRIPNASLFVSLDKDNKAVYDGDKVTRVTRMPDGGEYIVHWDAVMMHWQLRGVNGSKGSNHHLMVTTQIKLIKEAVK